MDLSKSALNFWYKFHNYDLLIIAILNGPKNRAILTSIPAVTSTSGDIATPPVHFLWKNRLPHSKHTDYKIKNHLVVKSFGGLKL